MVEKLMIPPEILMSPDLLPPPTNSSRWTVNNPYLWGQAIACIGVDLFEWGKNTIRFAAQYKNLSYNSETMAFLNSSGDFLNGYMDSFLLGIVMFAPGLTSKRLASLPDPIKVAGVVATSSLIVAAVETGLIPVPFNTASVEDIPAGIYGSLAWAGMHYLLRYTVAKHQS